MSDFDEAMVLERTGGLIEEGDLPPLAHGLLRLLAMAIEHEAEMEELRDLLHDMETTDVTIAIQEREEARDQARAATATLKQAQADLTVASRALTEIAADSPPDDWEWHSGGYFEGYGRRGDPDYVDAPDISNSGDMHEHGWACGRWSAAKIARAALTATKEGEDDE